MAYDILKIKQFLKKNKIAKAIFFYAMRAQMRIIVKRSKITITTTKMMRRGIILEFERETNQTVYCRMDCGKK